MQTSLVVVEEGRRSGNAGDASRDRPEGVHSLDASRFIGVSRVDSMEATGLTMSERLASSCRRDACALVTGGQSCTTRDSMLI